MTVKAIQVGPEDVIDLTSIDPVMDGTSIVSHSGHDHECWLNAYGTAPRLREAIDAHHAPGKLAYATYRDVFFSYLKRSVQTVAPDTLRPSHEILGTLIPTAINTQEYRALHAQTAGDIVQSVGATLHTAKALLEAIPSNVLQTIKNHAELEAQIDALAQDPDCEDGDQRVEALYAKAQRELELAEDEDRAGLSEEQIDSLRRSVRTVVATAEGEAEATAEILSVFGDAGNQAPGGNTTGGSGSFNGGTIGQKLQLAQDVRKNEKLRKIAEMAGRLQRIALNVQKIKIDTDPREVAGIEFGDDLSRVVPSDLALLADPDTADLFGMKFCAGSLMLEKLEAKEKIGRGPVIIAVDESGSMTGDRDVWAKGAGIALLSIARRQNRDAMVLHFAETGQLKREVFKGGRASGQELMEVASHFYNGGDTQFNPWMRAAISAVESSEWNKADVVLISDGYGSVDPLTAESWRKCRDDRGMRAMGVLIGTDDYSGVMRGLVDALITVNDLANTQDAEKMIFSV